MEHRTAKKGWAKADIRAKKGGKVKGRAQKHSMAAATIAANTAIASEIVGH